MRGPPGLNGTNGAMGPPVSIQASLSLFVNLLTCISFSLLCRD